MAQWALGHAYRSLGQLEEAGEACAEVMRLGQSLDNIWTQAMGAVDLGMVLRSQGRLDPARRVLQGLLHAAEERGAAGLGFIGRVDAALARVLYEQNDLDGARRQLAAAAEHNRHWQNPNHIVFAFNTLILTTIWTLWFTVAFGPYLMGLQWQGIEAFAAAFQPSPYVAWVLPCLLLALTFPVLLACIYQAAGADRKIWALLGLMFGVMYDAVLSANYWLLLTVVRESLLQGYTEGLSWFVIGSPHSLTNALEGIGYGFMGLATLFAGPAFAGGRLATWTRSLFIANGLAGVLGMVMGGLGSVPATLVSLAVWCVTFPVVTGLSAVHFRRMI